MENTSSPQPSADTAPTGSPADRAAVLDLILGESEVERVAQDIRQLRRFSDLALREAERLDRAAEARAARLDTAEMLLAAAPVAERLTDTDADTDTDEDGDVDAVESLQPSGETSLALHRLARVARLNIMLEQKLIADFKAPKTEAAPKPRDKAPAEPSRWAKFGAGAEVEQRKENARELTRDSADADERLDQEHVEALMAELEAEMASGKHDKALAKEWGNDVAEKFLKARGIKPNLGPGLLRVQAEMEAASCGRHADGTPRLRPAEYDELDADESPAARPQLGDPGSVAKTSPPDVAAPGTGPP